MPESSETIRSQYQDTANLDARIALHAQFSTNGYGWQRWVRERIDLDDGAQVLEVGCGPGTLWETGGAWGRRWDLVLTDLSAGMVKAARRTLAGAGREALVAVGAARRIPAPADSFDGVIANHMLYHVHDRDDGLAEIRRVLKPGGRLFATTVGAGHMQALWDLVAPYVPDILERVSSVSSGFTLENGEAQLRRHFATIERYDYVDGLAVTEVQPVIAYLRSSSALDHGALTDDAWAAVRRTVAAHIEVKGAFHVGKASGIFVAGEAV